jgi:hypothetical protein
LAVTRVGSNLFMGSFFFNFNIVLVLSFKIQFYMKLIFIAFPVLDIFFLVILLAWSQSQSLIVLTSFDFFRLFVDFFFQSHTSIFGLLEIRFCDFFLLLLSVGLSHLYYSSYKFTRVGLFFFFFFNFIILYFVGWKLSYIIFFLLKNRSFLFIYHLIKINQFIWPLPNWQIYFFSS